LKSINLKGGGDKTYSISARFWVNTLSDCRYPDDMWQIYYDYSNRDEEGVEIFVSSITIIGMISVTSQ
jgi:hypothetical protein